jgi:hypothetical protein
MPMSKQSSLIQTLIERRETIRAWIDSEADYTKRDQCHLDGASQEQGYWHHGYLSALNDVLALVNSHAPVHGSADKPSSC